MNTYRIESHTSRHAAMNSDPPVETLFSDSRRESTKAMHRLAAGGQYYAAVYINHDGECIEETADVQQ